MVRRRERVCEREGVCVREKDGVSLCESVCVCEFVCLFLRGMGEIKYDIGNKRGKKGNNESWMIEENNYHEE